MARSFRPSALWPRLAVAGLTVVVLVAAAILWPDRTRVSTDSVNAGLARGEVVRLTAVPCRAPQAKDCRLVDIKLTTGPDAGTTTSLTVGESGSDFRPTVGDEMRLSRNVVPEGVDPGDVVPYTLNDFERRAPLLWLALGFVAVVLLVSRTRGLRALIGLCASVAIVFGFIVPAVLAGTSPVAVALTGALAIMLVTIVITHGAGVLTLAAILGTTASLAVTAALGVAFVELAHLTGLSSDASTLLLAGRGDLSFEGIILAGLIIASLGVLDDVTVSQASVVLALRRANPSLGLRELYGSALRVGQDHSTATVNTLVLAYVGAALPVLLIFNASGARVGDALNSEGVAEEIVSMLAGSIGLLAAVPFTTLLAAWMALHLRAETLPVQHAHAH